MTIALDMPLIPPIWTPSAPWWRLPRRRKCPKCGKAKRGFFESLRDPKFMPVNGCCCGSVCLGCPGTQPSATVSGTSTNTPSYCASDGIYSFNSFNNSGLLCRWIWVDISVTHTVVVDLFTSGAWDIQVTSTFVGNAICRLDNTITPTFPLACISGALTGTVVLPLFSAGGCSGTSATVVFG